MKNKIINIIVYAFALYFILFTIMSFIFGCYDFSEYLLNKFSINIPPFALEILGFISFCCLCTTFIIEKEKREAKK